MSQRRWRPPKQGWDDDFTGTSARALKAPRGPVDEELLALQAAWAPGRPRRRKPELGTALATYDADLVWRADDRRSDVRSGGLNYDAPLMLEGLRRYERRGARPRSPGGDGGGDDDACFAYFEKKWDYIYAFVDRERARERREALDRARRAARGAAAAADDDFGAPFAGARPADDEDRLAVASLPDAPRAPRPRKATTWAALEAKLAAGAAVAVADVPWPLATDRIVDARAPAAARKDQWRAALRRFHPDKFQRVLAAAAPGDRSRILERCKAVTRRIIDERALL